MTILSSGWINIAYDVAIFVWIIFTFFLILCFHSRIGCLCAPTLFKKLREVKPKNFYGEICLFEYDKRFAVFGDNYIFYDYKDPLTFPSYVRENSFDVIFADPPFLNKECMEKVCKSVNFLKKDKVILCTGLFKANVRTVKSSYFMVERALSPFMFLKSHRSVNLWSIGQQYWYKSTFTLNAILAI